MTYVDAPSISSKAEMAQAYPQTHSLFFFAIFFSATLRRVVSMPDDQGAGRVGVIGAYVVFDAIFRGRLDYKRGLPLPCGL